MRFRSLTGAASLYCILRRIVRIDNTLLLKVEIGFCSGTVVPPVSVEFGAKRVE
jgi:hypothetical protein